MIAALRSNSWNRAGTRYAAAGAALVALTAALVVAAGLIGFHPELLQGWLLAVAIWSCAPIGGMTLLMIHRLTGGRWGRAAGAVLRPLAAMMPLVAIAFIPVLAGLPHIYPWAADPGLVKPDVARWYLGQPLFILRAVVALAGWSVLGVTFALGAGGRLLAALGLAFFGLTISLVAVDWFLSVEPHYVDTSFAAMMAIQQLLAALAVTAVLGMRDADGVSDIGSFLLATLLGVLYLEYMTFVVAWYGDLPHKAEWFLRRSTAGWSTVVVATFAVGAVLPFAMLLLRRVRGSQAALRIVGLLVLAGTIMHLAWLIVPAFAAQASVAISGLCALAILTIASVLCGRGIASAKVRHAD